MVNLSIGCGKNKNALLAAKFLNKEENFHIELANSDEELVSALNNEKFDAVIRGSLKSFNILKNININNINEIITLDELNNIDEFINIDEFNNVNELNNLNKSNITKLYINKSTELNRSNSLNNISKLKMNETNKTKSIYRASYIKSNIDQNHQFLLGPVGIDEGDNINDKLNLAIFATDFMNKIGKHPKIAILAGGRKEDFGRSPIIDKSIEESEELVEKIEKSISNSSLSSNFQVKNYYILIEKAIKEKNNIIIAPDGIIGNIIFRSLVLLSSWESYGAIALGMNKIFIDTSRDQTKEGYIRALRFAQSLVENDL